MGENLQSKWIKENKKNCIWDEYVKNFNREFNLNISVDAMRKRYARVHKKNAKKNDVIVYDKKQGIDVNWRKWFSQFGDIQKRLYDESNNQDEVTIEIEPDNNRVGIAFSADWHLGSIACDYISLQKHIELLLKHDNIKLVTVGDLIDNFKKFRSLSAIFSQIATPCQQGKILFSMLKELIDSKTLLAACWGNHDVEFDEKLFGQSPIAEMLATKIPYFNTKGKINLIVGEQKYVIIVAHNLRGYSYLNKNHPQRRALWEYYPDADVIVSAHLHEPAIQNIYYNQRRVNFIQTGTFKIDDNYSKRYWQKGIIGVPFTIFRSDRHEAFTYPSADEYLDKNT